MADITDREKLELSCRLTIEFNFGLICDAVTKLATDGALDPRIAEILKRQVRLHGNDARRVIVNHLEFYNVSRNHRKDEINPTAVLDRVQQG